MLRLTLILKSLIFDMADLIKSADARGNELIVDSSVEEKIKGQDKVKNSYRLILTILITI